MRGKSPSFARPRRVSSFKAGAGEQLLNLFQQPVPLIAILIPRDYWTRSFEPGNTPGHRALPDILAALTRAGGEGVLVETGASGRVEDFAGMVLPGGVDVHPRYYGQELLADPGNLDPEHDEFQLSWARAALAVGLPLLGICRGMQLLNVAAGGTLVQDIPDHLHPTRRTDAIHSIDVEAGSCLRSVLGSGRVPVNSIHHQAVELLGHGWRPVAWAPDGVVEAVERADAPWQRGVQFHPEDLCAQAEFQALFEALVGCR